MRPNFALTSCYYGGVTSYSSVNCYTGETVFCKVFIKNFQINKFI